MAIRPARRENTHTRRRFVAENLEVSKKICNFAHEKEKKKKCTMAKYKYINFPVHLLQDFFYDPAKAMASILGYHLFSMAFLVAKMSNDAGKAVKSFYDVIQIACNNEVDDFSAWMAKAFPYYVSLCKEHYGIKEELEGERDAMPPDLSFQYEIKGIAPARTIPHLWNRFTIGTIDYLARLADDLHGRRPAMTAITMQTFMAYSKKGEITEFEYAVLLMHLAFHSILRDVEYKSISRELILARMNGDETEGENPLTSKIEHYGQPHNFNVLLNELQEKWHLACCYDPDFDRTYYSYRLTHDELAERINSHKVKRTIAEIHADYRQTVKDALAAYNQQHPMPGKVKK